MSAKSWHLRCGLSKAETARFRLRRWLFMRKGGNRWRCVLGNGSRSKKQNWCGLTSNSDEQIVLPSCPEDRRQNPLVHPEKHYCLIWASTALSPKRFSNAQQTDRFFQRRSVSDVALLKHKVVFDVTRRIQGWWRPLANE